MPFEKISTMYNKNSLHINDNNKSQNNTNIHTNNFIGKVLPFQPPFGLPDNDDNSCNCSKDIYKILLNNQQNTISTLFDEFFGDD